MESFIPCKMLQLRSPLKQLLWLLLFVPACAAPFGLPSPPPSLENTPTETVPPTEPIRTQAKALAPTEPPVAASPTTIEATPEPVHAATPTNEVTCTAGNPEVSKLYDHRVMRTSSSDGINFERESELIIEHASVPDGVIGPDGAQWVYFVNGEPGQHGVFAARELSEGEWEIIDCVRIDGVFEGDAVDPNVVRLSDGRYRLFYYLGHFVTPVQPGNYLHPIYSAISEDGINFTLEQKLIEMEGITDPTAIELPDGSWLLAFVKAQEGNPLLATSLDGFNFTLTDNLFEVRQCANEPLVTFGTDPATQPQACGGIPELGLLADGRVVLYTSRIFISNDNGSSWEATDAFVPGGGADPSLVPLSDGSYYFYYKTFDGPGGNPQPVGTPEQQPAGDTPGQPLLPSFTPTDNG